MAILYQTVCFYNFGIKIYFCRNMVLKVRPLSNELQAKAIKELKEDPERLEEDLKAIRLWLSQQSFIRARTDDQWLVAFLRGCKFSLERTKEKLDMFYTMKTIVPELMTNRDPMAPEIQEILNMGVYLPLPNTASADSPACMLFRSGTYDPSKIKATDLFKVNLMIIDITIMENDNFVVGGGQMCQDMTNVTMAHMTAMSPALAKKGMTIFQDAYPVRPKGMHFINIPTFFDMIFQLFKPFMKDKMLKRMTVHSGKDFTDLYKSIPHHVLPKEYGGEAPSCAEIAAFWKKKVESYRDWFLEDDKYGTDERRRPGNPKTTENVFGLEGSFRKLNVD